MQTRWIALTLALTTASFAQSAAHPSTEKFPDKAASIIAQKSWPLLHALQHNAIFLHSAANKSLGERFTTGDQLSRCTNARCTTSALKFSDEEEAASADALTHLYETNKIFRVQIEPVLNIGAYAHPDIREAFKADAAGINKAISIYGEASAPPYPLIDSMELKPEGKEFALLLRNAMNVVKNETRPGDAFFAIRLRAAAALLRISDREDVASFEPMERNLNAPAIARARTVNWSRYPYSAILIPGVGPDVPGQPLSPMGATHVAMAVQRYREGKAPFIIASGGSVHPAHTRFVEAIEMRRDLIDRYGIPANAILIEPHARHTTTNLRNAVREVIQYKLPVAKPILIVANDTAAAGIASPKFADRNMRELGYLPWIAIKQTGPNDVEYTPNKESLRVDALSPLDP